MEEFFQNSWVTLVLMGALLAILVAGGIYIIRKVREPEGGKEPTASEWLTKFKELHAQGELSDQEYRTIKSVLSEQLQQELNSTDKTA
jgi:5-bromo-4-chloroindolyl phosphate hydrolysis protein